MNERIRELAEPAGIATNINTDFFEKDSNKWVDYFAEKFADLIILEVVQHLTNKGLDHAREVIEKEFGVSQ